MATQRVLIVDDHPMVRTGLRSMVSDEPHLKVVGEAANGPDAIRAVARLAPHLVLMDMTMRGMNGIEATAEIKRRHPDVRVLIVTMHSNKEYVEASLNAGADGYVLKDAGAEELHLAIRTALKNAPARINDKASGVSAD